MAKKGLTPCIVKVQIMKARIYEMGYYEIVVENHIDHKRLRDFEGFEFRHIPDGNTLLCGMVKDQSELFSLLSRIRDMNLTLVSIRKDQKELEER